ncbi:MULTISPECIES: hypothetical protein [Protofrankia]|nr:MULTISPECIES: hypothetical protein [Protofrankia]
MVPLPVGEVPGTTVGDVVFDAADVGRLSIRGGGCPWMLTEREDGIA